MVKQNHAFHLLFIFVLSVFPVRIYGQVVYQQRLADRVLIFNTLKSIYGESQNEFLLKEIIHQGQLFGGPCDYYEQIRTGPGLLDLENLEYACPGDKEVIRLPLSVKDSIVRKGKLGKICQQVSEDPLALKNAVEKKMKKKLSQIPLNDDIADFFRLFNLTTEVEPKGLDKIISSSGMRELGILDQWILISNLACRDMSWQIL
jgi:hypothetical protein